jgi:hypothetical protein
VRGVVSNEVPNINIMTAYFHDNFQGIVTTGVFQSKGIETIVLILKF